MSSLSPQTTSNRKGTAFQLPTLLPADNCKKLTSVPRHIYSIRKFGNQLYYSDWEAGEVAVIDLQTGQKGTIASNLMRPTEITMKWDGQEPGQCSYSASFATNRIFGEKADFK